MYSRKDKNKEEEAGNGPFKKIFIFGPKFLRQNFFLSQMVFKELGVGRNSLKLEKPIEWSMKKHK